MNIKSDFFKNFIIKNKFQYFEYEDQKKKGKVLNRETEFKSNHDLNEVFQIIIKVIHNS